MFVSTLVPHPIYRRLPRHTRPTPSEARRDGQARKVLAAAATAGAVVDKRIVTRVRHGEALRFRVQLEVPGSPGQDPDDGHGRKKRREAKRTAHSTSFFLRQPAPATKVENCISATLLR